LKYWRFQPAPGQFPPATLRLAPRLDFGLAPSSRHYRRVDAGQNSALYTRARYALTEAFRQAGLGPSRGLLAPAYHCRTMLDPAIALGAPIGLYALDAGLAPRMDSLQKLHAQAPEGFGALLVPHYFGFRQDLASLRAWCDDRRIALIEDCSHLFVVSSEDAGEGPGGHWRIASPYKFVGSSEGGLLWPASPSPLSARPAAELRGLIKALRARLQQGSAVTAPAANAAATAGANPSKDGLVEDDQVSPQFDPREIGCRGAPWAGWLIKRAPFDALARTRRQRFEKLLACVAGLNGCRPLFDRLGPRTVPHAFPLLLEQPDPHFFQLKQLGVEFGRWDDLAVSDCEVSQDLRLRLIQVPCHQGLSDAQFDWICAQLQTVFAPAHEHR